MSSTAPSARAPSSTRTTPHPVARCRSSRTTSARAVLPLYANTHTESSGTGLQTSRYREEARAIIAECTGATDDHVVLFCGSGSTYAIDKLIGVLGIRVPSNLDDRWHVTDAIPADERPVVFIGPFEHHSNELSWRESIADVVTIHESADGHVDLAHLDRGARALRRPAAQDRVVLGRIQCHRHHHRHRRRLGARCTSTARWRSGTSPPPRPTSTSTWGRPTTRPSSTPSSSPPTS